jgi:hypothetical protein
MPSILEYKQVITPIGIERNGNNEFEFKLTNKLFFSNMNHIDGEYEIKDDIGNTIEKNIFKINDINAQETKVIKLSVNDFDKKVNTKYFINLTFKLNEEKS